MKTVFNIVLVLCAAALIYICYTSIMGPINFENAKKEREKAVIARLIDIRRKQSRKRAEFRESLLATSTCCWCFRDDKRQRFT